MVDRPEPKPWYVELAKFLLGKLTEARLRDGGAEGRVFTMSFETDWTGHSNSEERLARAAALRAACDAALNDPSLAASDIDGDGDLDTKCNWGLQRIAAELGCLEFSGKRANEIHAMCLSKPLDYDSLSPERAVEAAKAGGLVVASLPNPAGSGHVAVVYPTSSGFSGTLNRPVPMVANIGKPPNGVVPASKGFPVARYGEICWFLWRRSMA